MLVTCPSLWSPVERAIGFDPGAPRVHWAVVERGGERSLTVVGYGSIEWRERPAAEAELRALYAEHTPARCAVEDQFLNYAIFAEEDQTKRSQMAGAFFSSLKQLAQVSGAIGATWSRWAREHGAEEGAWSVPNGTWKATLAPAQTSTRDAARDASLALAALLTRGPGSRGNGWRKEDHDLAAAISIAVAALGVPRVADLVPGWPPPDLALRPARKRRPKKK